MVDVPGFMDGLTDEDKSESLTLLKGLYDRTVWDAPDGLPAFDGEAAMWAACYLYRTIQLVMLRRLGEEEVRQQLADHTGKRSPAVIYSVDLCFRHLPGLFQLAKGLAPGDILVSRLQEQARLWPFSSVGIEVEEADVTMIAADPCLRQLYVDRIIQAKDILRARNERIVSFVAESLGEHAATLWPGFKTIDVHEPGQTDSGPDQ